MIERIRFLIDRAGIDPARICAFTFTNKAAGELASRLQHEIGQKADSVKRGTIHAFCADLLREFGSAIDVPSGFGIVDEEYQLAILRRLEGPRRWHRSVLTRFSAHRLRGDPLKSNDAALFAGYERFLATRNLLDFDTLVLRARDLLVSPAASKIRKLWDAILVDEFQDLNPTQYQVVRSLALEHHNIFAVGDDEQSIFSWAGADPAVFTTFLEDFGISNRIYLQENYRCPREIFSTARQLIETNASLFTDRVVPIANRDSKFPACAYEFDTDSEELTWLIADINSDRVENGLEWGDIAVLYRTHAVGEGVETGFIRAGIPCRLAYGRAFSEDPIIAYLVAALRVIAKPQDELSRDAFFASVLRHSLFDEVRAQAESTGRDLRWQLNHELNARPDADEGKRQIRRALYAWRNLEALGRKHVSVESLIVELLSQRVGAARSVLEEHHDELTDPASKPEVVRLSERIRTARAEGLEIWMPRQQGVEIALKGMLAAVGFSRVQLGGIAPADAVIIDPADAPTLGLALALFKAIQLLEVGNLADAFQDFTVVDLETTDDKTDSAEIVEVAAVRVRNGEPVDEFCTLVRPNVAITTAATAVHGINDVDVLASPGFETVWPQLREFCRDDVVVAHNGYEFDFVILRRMAKSTKTPFDFCLFDTLPLARDLVPTSRKLSDLAKAFGIDPGRSHRALDDTRTLARVFMKLNEAKASRARKTCLGNLLDFLALALWLSGDPVCAEGQLLRRLIRVFPFGRYSTCLEFYEREQAGDEALPTADEVIELLGGPEVMIKMRSDRNADERYPATMQRLRRLVSGIPHGSIHDQIMDFLARVVLSRSDGIEPEKSRVNLLTLHSTKGLEFSRVYIVGVEDAQLPGGSPSNLPSVSEVEESRRLLYVGMTRAMERVVLTRVKSREGLTTGAHRFLDELQLKPRTAEM